MLPNIETTDRITHIELATLKRDRGMVEAMKAELAALAQSVHDREQDVIARIEAGVPVDGIAKVMDRRRQAISWLTVLKRELGEAAVIKAKDEWPVTFSKELQIG